MKNIDELFWMLNFMFLQWFWTNHTKCFWNVSATNIDWKIQNRKSQNIIILGSDWPDTPSQPNSHTPKIQNVLPNVFTMFVKLSFKMFFQCFLLEHDVEKHFENFQHVLDQNIWNIFSMIWGWEHDKLVQNIPKPETFWYHWRTILNNFSNVFWINMLTLLVCWSEAI